MTLGLDTKNASPLVTPSWSSLGFFFVDPILRIWTLIIFLFHGKEQVLVFYNLNVLVLCQNAFKDSYNLYWA